jgi:hypothetical protein
MELYEKYREEVTEFPKITKVGLRSFSPHETDFHVFVLYKQRD